MKRIEETLYDHNTWDCFKRMVFQSAILDVSAWLFLVLGCVFIPIAATGPRQECWIIVSVVCFGISIVSLSIEHRHDPDPSPIPETGEQSSSRHATWQRVCDTWNAYFPFMKIIGGAVLFFALCVVASAVVMVLLALAMLIRL